MEIFLVSASQDACQFTQHIPINMLLLTLWIYHICKKNELSTLDTTMNEFSAFHRSIKVYNHYHQVLPKGHLLPLKHVFKTSSFLFTLRFQFLVFFHYWECTSYKTQPTISSRQLFPVLNYSVFFYCLLLQAC